MSAASTESTMSFGVTGKWCDIDGVWIDPVMAQMMMTLPLSDGDVGTAALIFLCTQKLTITVLARSEKV